MFLYKMIVGFLRLLWFPPPIHLTATIQNIVEGGSKHPNPLKWSSAGPSILRLHIFIFITSHAYYVYIWIKHLLKQYWCCWTGENLSYHTTHWSGCLCLQRYNALFYFGAISLWCVVSLFILHHWNYILLKQANFRRKFSS